MLAFASLAAITPLAAGPIEVVARGSDQFNVTVDGSAPPDARVYENDERGIILIDIPSQSKCLLVDTRGKKAVTVSRWNIKLGDDDRTLRISETRRDGPVVSVTIDQESLVLRTDSSEVRLVRSSRRSTATPPAPPGVDPKPDDDEEARSCLQLEARPEGHGVQGCTKFVYLANRCGTPVIAAILRIEHLINGTLPNSFSVEIPADREFPLGCSWYSGATAPTNYEIRGAVYTRRPADRRDGKGDCEDRP